MTTEAAPTDNEQLVALDDPAFRIPTPAMLDTSEVQWSSAGKVLVDCAERFVPALLARALQSSGHSRHFFRDGFTASTIERQICTALSPHVLQVYAFELRLAAACGALQGSDPRQRYSHFVAGSCSAGFMDYVLGKYQGLQTRVVAIVGGYIRLVEVIKSSLRADLHEIRESVCDQADSSLADIRFLGDAHLGGTRSARVVGSNGSSLFYKPRGVQSEETFKEILRELRLDPLRFIIPQFLGRGGYSWHEEQSTGSTDDRESYYRALGRWLAFAYLTSSYDLHYENLVFDGSNAAVVDLECMFAGRRKTQMSRAIFSEHDIIDDLLMTGILPHSIGVARRGASVNLGALGGDAHAVAGKPYYRVEDDGSDMLRVRRDFYDSQPDDVGAGHAAELIRGYPWLSAEFVRTFKELSPQAKRIRAVLDRLAPASRLIMRPTQLYGEALIRSAHPSALIHDVKAEAAISDFLSRTVRGGPAEKVAEVEFGVFEAPALHRGDIPLYAIEYGQTSFPVQAREYPLESARSIILRRTNRANSSAHRRHLEDNLAKTMAAHIATVRGRAGETVSFHRALQSSITVDPAKSAILIGNQLALLASRARTSPTPLSVVGPLDNRWESQPMGVDLYNGEAGVMLALAALRACGLGDDAKSIVQICSRTQRSLQANESTTPIGAFTGLTGGLYSLAAARRLAPDLVPTIDFNQYEHVLARIESDLATDPSQDIIAGAAGIVLVVSELVRTRILPRERGRPIVLAAGRRLRETAEVPERGHLAWRNDWAGDWLGGISHGVGGVAWAMSRVLAEYPEESVFADVQAGADAAQAALLLPGEDPRWADRRPAEQLGEHDFEAWCHGAEGLLLAALDATTDGSISRVDEIRMAIAQLPLTLSNCLCHGAAGRVVALLECERRLPKSRGDTEQIEQSRKALVAKIATSAFEQNIASPVELWNESLMLGRAGMLWALSASLAYDAGNELSVNPLCLRL